MIRRSTRLAERYVSWRYRHVLVSRDGFENLLRALKRLSVALPAELEPDTYRALKEIGAALDQLADDVRLHA